LIPDPTHLQGRHWKGRAFLETRCSRCSARAPAVP
jgi:hypothetical protein